MTPQEFKAWFEGFTEAFDRLPTKAQWARVKERVAEIDGKPVTEKVFVDRYWPRYYPEYRPYWAYQGAGGIAGAALGGLSQAQCSNGFAQTSAANSKYQAAATAYNTNSQQSFNSNAAMTELGRADAKVLAA